jgi:hypothetical protein
MFKVYEMSGSFSKEVAMFETEVEASDYIIEEWNEANKDGYSVDFDSEEIAMENFISYFSIEDDGRELISHDDLIEQYDNMLDDCYNELFNMTPSYILSKCDPLQYSCGLSDYYDSISDSYYCEEME